MQVPGANNSKFGVLVASIEKYLEGNDYYGNNSVKHILYHGDKNKVEIPFTAGINRNTKNRHSTKGNVEI